MLFFSQIIETIYFSRYISYIISVLKIVDIVIAEIIFAVGLIKNAVLSQIIERIYFSHYIW